MKSNTFDDSLNHASRMDMLILVIVLMIIVFGIVLAVIIAFVEASKSPPPEPTDLPTYPAGIEIIPINGTEISNYITNNSSIKIARGPYITTNLIGDLVPSWSPSNEWTCKNLRIYSANYPDLALTLDSEPGLQEGDLTAVSLKPYDKGNPLQFFYYNNSKILLYHTEAKIILQGLATKTTYKNESPGSALFSNSATTLTHSINLNGNVYDVQNPVQAQLLPINYDVSDYYNLKETPDNLFIWNCGAYYISSSLGGILAMQTGTNKVLFVSPEEKTNLITKVVVINNHIYFLGNKSDTCYLLVNDGELYTLEIPNKSLLENTEMIEERVKIIE